MFPSSLCRFEYWDSHHHQDQVLLFAILLIITSSASFINRVFFSSHSCSFYLFAFEWFTRFAYAPCASSKLSKPLVYWKWMQAITFPYFLPPFKFSITFLNLFDVDKYRSVLLDVPHLFHPFHFSLIPLCPCVHSCECECIHEDALPPISPGVFNFSTDGALGNARLYFPGCKVGKIYLFIPTWSLTAKWCAMTHIHVI